MNTIVSRLIIHQLNCDAVNEHTGTESRRSDAKTVTNEREKKTYNRSKQVRANDHGQGIIIVNLEAEFLWPKGSFCAYDRSLNTRTPIRRSVRCRFASIDRPFCHENEVKLYLNDQNIMKI